MCVLFCVCVSGVFFFEFFSSSVFVCFCSCFCFFGFVVGLLFFGGFVVVVVFVVFVVFLAFYFVFCKKIYIYIIFVCELGDHGKLMVYI